MVRLVRHHFPLNILAKPAYCNRISNICCDCHCKLINKKTYKAMFLSCRPFDYTSDGPDRVLSEVKIFHPKVIWLLLIWFQRRFFFSQLASLKQNRKGSLPRTK